MVASTGGGVVTAKYPLCWECNRKFRGNHKHVVETENGPVAVHKACAEKLGQKVSA
jgi:hypothetical protein